MLNVCGAPKGLHVQTQSAVQQSAGERISPGTACNRSTYTLMRSVVHAKSLHWQTLSTDAVRCLRMMCDMCADRPFQTMLDELRRLKEEYPDRILIASIMEEYNK